MSSNFGSVDYTSTYFFLPFFRYGKYKPLSQPAKCVKCSEKKVKFAYHTLCQDCVEVTGHCAKCNQAEELVNKPAETEAIEAAKLEAELKLELKALPERKRRTFMRYLKTQEKRSEENNSSLSKIRQEAKDKLNELKDKFNLEEDFEGLDFEDSSEDE